MEVIVYGTPAEEGGGGKISMIKKGVFDEAEICMMSHPTPFEIPAPMWLSRAQLRAVFKGFFLFVKVCFKICYFTFFTFLYLLFFKLLIIKLMIFKNT